jgi:uncharacterized repeat protein (TIGR02543 family)
VDLSDNAIGDIGAGKISRLANLGSLDLSGNNIGDIGAKLLAATPNAANLTIDLSNNHIGTDGIMALAAAGFKELKLGGQTVTLGAIKNGRLPIEFTPPGGVQNVVTGTISGGGRIDTRKGSIVWPAQTRNTTFTYGYSCQGYGGTALVPFVYKPFTYTVTFDDLNGKATKVAVNDLDQVDSPPDPVRKEYVFHGWSKDRDGTEPFDFGTPIERDIYLYARWGPPLPLKYHKSISGVHAYAKATSVEVTWNRVKSAKGYFIFKYSPATKRYSKVGSVEARNRNSWVDKKVAKGKIYRYKVQPYKIVNGKKKRVKASYWVSAIVGSEQYSNAVSVKLSQSKAIKKKAGRTAKLRATVSGIPGKQLLNSKVRWCTSDKKIASVSKSGVVKLRKKGKCYVWAKAHDGVNSKRVKVVVR